MKSKRNRGVASSSPAKTQKIYLYTKGGEYSLNGIEYVGEYHIENGVPKVGPIPMSLENDINRTTAVDSISSNVRLSKKDKPSEGGVLRRLYANKDQYTYDSVKGFKVPVVDFVDPKPYIWKPNEAAYEATEGTRYFVEKINDEGSFAIEIDPEQYQLIGLPRGIDNGLYSFTSIRWKLVGSRDYITTFNQQQLYQAAYIVPSILYSVKNFTEYARFTTF